MSSEQPSDAPDVAAVNDNEQLHTRDKLTLHPSPLQTQSAKDQGKKKRRSATTGHVRNRSIDADELSGVFQKVLSNLAEAEHTSMQKQQARRQRSGLRRNSLAMQHELPRQRSSSSGSPRGHGAASNTTKHNNCHHVRQNSSSSLSPSLSSWGRRNSRSNPLGPRRLKVNVMGDGEGGLLHSNWSSHSHSPLSSSSRLSRNARTERDHRRRASLDLTSPRKQEFVLEMAKLGHQQVGAKWGDGTSPLPATDGKKKKLHFASMQVEDDVPIDDMNSMQMRHRAVSGMEEFEREKKKSRRSPPITPMGKYSSSSSVRPPSSLPLTRAQSMPIANMDALGSFQLPNAQLLHEHVDVLSTQPALHDFLFVLQTLPHDKMMDTVKEMFVRLQQYHTLLSEADKITVDLNRDDTLYGVIERLDALVTSQDVFAFLVNHENGACECVASKHALQNGYVLPKGAGLPGWVVKHEASVRVADAQKDARFAPTTQSKLKDLAKGVLAVPVTDKDFRVIGVLMLCNKVNGSFTQDDLTMVEFIALLAGHAIEHALLYDEILVKQDDTEMLMQMQEVISGQQDRKKVFERVREAVAVLVPSDRVRVWVLDHEKQEMQLFEPSTSTSRATTPRLEGKKLSPKKKKQTQRDTHVASEGKTSFSPFVKPLVTNVPLGRGVLGFTLRSVQTSNFSNPLKDFRFDPTWDMRDPSLPIRNMLCVPVVNQDGQPVAIVECVNCVGNTDGYTKQHELLLESLAISAGACVHKIDLYEQAVQRQQQMEALLQITELIGQELELKKVIQKIVMAAHMLVECESVAVFMVSEDRRNVEERLKDGTKGKVIPIGTGVEGHVALTGKNFNSGDYRSEWRLPSLVQADMVASAEANIPSSPSSSYASSSFSSIGIGGSNKHKKLQRDVTNSVLVLPIKDYGSKTLAVLQLRNRISKAKRIIHFHASDEVLLNSLTMTAGTVLKKAIIFNEVSVSKMRREALFKLMELMVAETDSKKVMDRIIEASYNLVCAMRITLYVVDHQTQELVCAVSKDKSYQGARMSMSHGIVGHVAFTRRSLNIKNAYSDPRFDNATDKYTHFKTNSILTVPVTNRNGATVAVIQAVNKFVRGVEVPFSGEDVHSLESMAVTAGLLLDKSRLYEQAVFAERRSRALMSLLKVVNESSELALDVLIDRIISVAYVALRCEGVLIYFVDYIKEEVWAVVKKRGRAVKIRTPIVHNRGFASHVASTGEKLNVFNCRANALYDEKFTKKTGYMMSSVLCMPIKDVGGRVIAVAQAINKFSDSSSLTARSSPHSETLASPSDVFQASDKGNSVDKNVRRGKTTWTPNTTHRTLEANKESAQKPASSSSSSFTYSSSPSPKGGKLSFATPSFRRDTVPEEREGGGEGNRASGSSKTMQSFQHVQIKPGGPLDVWIDEDVVDLGASLEEKSGLFTDRAVSPLTVNVGGGTLKPAAGTIAFSPRGVRHSSGESGESVSKAFRPFEEEDEVMLGAICHELGSLIIKQQTNAILASTSVKDKTLIDFYKGNAKMTLRRASVSDSEAGGLTTPTFGGQPRASPPETTTDSGVKIEKRASTVVLWPSVDANAKLSELNSLAFDVWKYTPEDLLMYSYALFEEMGFFRQEFGFTIEPVVMKNFLLAVKNGYNDNPFHNWYHGFSVLHFCYLFVRVLVPSMTERDAEIDGKEDNTLSPMNVFTLMVAAMCHDIDHPGNTNSYEIAVQSELALRHNDRSVLENHHAFKTVSVLIDPKTNVLAAFGVKQFPMIKKRIIGAILKTDMSMHFDECKRLDGRDVTRPFDIANENTGARETEDLLNTLLHTADLSAQTYHAAVAKEWERRISLEFAEQAEKEKAHGLVPAAFMCNLDDLAIRGTNQANFINFVLIPWWSNMHRLFPTLKPCMDNLINNRRFYTDDMAKSGSEAEEKKEGNE